MPKAYIVRYKRLRCLSPNPDLKMHSDGCSFEWNAHKSFIGNEHPIRYYKAPRMKVSWMNKGRGLSPDEINHYMKMEKAIRLTMELQEKVDDIYRRRNSGAS
jgi:hypothetical protein